LVGRAGQVTALRSLLLGNRARLVTLTGPPGVGKTRLAVETAASLADDFAGGIAWVELGPVRDAAQVLAEIARSLGTVAAGGVSVESVAASLADRHRLIVVDNCEHLLDSAPAIGQLIEQLPRLRVLATSRQRLHLLVETEYPVPPLPMPAVADADDLNRLAGNPAVELLLARAPAHVTLTRRTARSLADICVRLDGLPLALELAAARLRIFTPAELAFRLEHRTIGLSGAPRDAPARHRTLVAAIDWSHELLPDNERAAFANLSVLVGHWTLADAQAVCGASSLATQSAVESLLDHSLLRRVPTDGPARFAMLASIHDYAAAQLLDSGRQGLTRDRHAHYFADAARAWEATLGTETENATWVEFDATQPDLAAAFAHLVAGEDRAWLGVTLAWFAHIHGSLREATTVVDALHQIVDGDRTQPLTDDVRTAALTAAGVLGLGRGELDAAEADLRRAIALSDERGDARRRGVATSFLGHVARARGRAGDAAGHYRTARALCAARGDVRGTAWAAYDLGLLAAEGDDAAERSDAEPLLREALAYFETFGYEWAIAQSARGLATVLLDRGAVDEAAELLARSVVLHDQVGDRRGYAECLEALGQVAISRGAPPAAVRLLGAADAQRQLGATTPNAPEQRRVAAVESAALAALGPIAIDHEKHTGRTAARETVLALAAEVAAVPAPVPIAAVVLTARQSQVADLVADGRTNRQIARALGISEKTAEIHVSNIMSRLDVPSRAGIAAWVAAHPAAPSP
jgi:non-specific serine/threonine protein kinase